MSTIVRTCKMNTTFRRNTMLKHLLILLTLAMSTATFNVNAEQSKAFGDYTVHFSAFTTDLLSSEVAKLYRIPRSRNRALARCQSMKFSGGGSALLSLASALSPHGYTVGKRRQFRPFCISENVISGTTWTVSQRRSSRCTDTKS